MLTYLSFSFALRFLNYYEMDIYIYLNNYNKDE